METDTERVLPVVRELQHQQHEIDAVFNGEREWHMETVYNFDFVGVANAIHQGINGYTELLAALEAVIEDCDEHGLHVPEEARYAVRKARGGA